MNEVDALQGAYARAHELVDGLESADMLRPTPCSEWNGRAPPVRTGSIFGQ